MSLELKTPYLTSMLLKRDKLRESREYQKMNTEFLT